MRRVPVRGEGGERLQPLALEQEGERFGGDRGEFGERHGGFVFLLVGDWEMRGGRGGVGRWVM